MPTKLSDIDAGAIDWDEDSDINTISENEIQWETDSALPAVGDELDLVDWNPEPAKSGPQDRPTDDQPDAYDPDDIWSDPSFTGQRPPPDEGPSLAQRLIPAVGGAVGGPFATAQLHAVTGVEPYRSPTAEPDDYEGVKALVEGYKGLAKSTARALNLITRDDVDIPSSEDYDLENPLDRSTYYWELLKSEGFSAANEAVAPIFEKVAELDQVQPDLDYYERLEEKPKFTKYMEEVVGMAPQMASQLAAHMIGGPITSGVWMALQIAGSEYDGMIEKGADPARAEAAAWGSALSQAPLEALSLGFVLNNPISRRLVKGGLVKFGLNRALGGATEWITETVQKVPAKFWENWAQDPDYLQKLQDNPELLKTLVAQGLQEGMSEGNIAAFYGAIFGVSGDVKARRQAKPKTKLPPVTAKVLEGIQQDLKEGSLTADDIEVMRADMDQAHPLYSELGALVGEEPAAKGPEAGERLTDLEGLITEVMGKEKNPEIVRVDPEKKNVRSVIKVGEALGLDVIVYRGKGQANGLNGLIDTTTGQIYLNETAQDPYLTVLGHESLHRLKKDHKDLYGTLVEKVKDLDIDISDYLKEVNKNRKAAGVAEITAEEALSKEEYIADFVGHQFSNKDFWKKLNNENPTVGKQLAQIITDLVDAIKTAMRKGKSIDAQFFKEMNQAQDALASVYGEFARRESKVEDKTKKPEPVETVKPMTTEEKAARAAEMPLRIEFDHIAKGLSTDQKKEFAELLEDTEGPIKERLSKLKEAIKPKPAAGKDLEDLTNEEIAKMSPEQRARTVLGPDAGENEIADMVKQIEAFQEKQATKTPEQELEGIITELTPAQAKDKAIADIVGDTSAAAGQRLGALKNAIAAYDKKHPEVGKKPKVSKKGSNIRTFRGAVLAAGGIKWGDQFKGERKEMPQAMVYLTRQKTGMPWDTLQQQLRDDGWLGPDENLLDAMTDEAILKRGRVTEDILEKKGEHLTEQERAVKKEMKFEAEEPPPGDYQVMEAEDLPEGKKLTIIEAESTRGWDVYEVVEKDPFGITLKDGITIELKPTDKVQVRKTDLAASAKKDELPESIKSATRKEKISLLRRAGFTGIKGMTDADIDDALIRVMQRIKSVRYSVKPAERGDTREIGDYTLKLEAYEEIRGEDGKFHDIWRVYDKGGNRMTSKMFTSEEAATSFAKELPAEKAKFAAKNALKDHDKPTINAFHRSARNTQNGDDIRKRIKRLDGTAWAGVAIKSVLTRQAIEDTIDGKPATYENPLEDKRSLNFKNRLIKHGEEGMWSYLSKRSIIGTAKKPINSISGSFAECDPSKNCANVCYAATGRRNAAIFIKAESVNWAIEKDPIRAAKMAAAQYHILMDFDVHKALRMFDRGEAGGPNWTTFINELNKQGIRTQIFSKRPDFIRSVSDMNLAMLSIDSSNTELADANPDLPIAVIYEGEHDIDMLEKYKDRFETEGGVILPIIYTKTAGKGIPDKEWTPAKIARIPEWTEDYLCPIDAGSKKIGRWNCTKCDSHDGLPGCFFGKSTAKVLEKLPDRLTSDEIQYRVEDLKKFSEEIKNVRSRERFDAGLDLLISEIRGGRDRGAAETLEDSIPEVSGRQPRGVRRAATKPAKGDVKLSVKSVKPWPKDFPKATVHTNLSKLTGHEQYKEAKTGSAKAAAIVAGDLVNVAKAEQLGIDYPDATLLPVLQREEGGNNNLPLALARAISKYSGLPVSLEAMEIHKSGRTAKTALTKLTARPIFEGEIEAGKEYILIDDALAQGGTISELRHFVDNVGAKVVNIQAFAAAQYSTVIAPNEGTIEKIEERFGREETEKFLKDYNIAGSLEALTEREASYLLKFRSLNAIRARAVEEGIPGIGQTFQRGLFDKGTIADEETVAESTDTVKFSPKFKKPGQLELPIFKGQQHEIEFGEKAIKVEHEKPPAKVAKKPAKKVKRPTDRIQSRIQKTRMATTGWIGSAGKVVRNVDEAASLLSHIRKSAQEQAYTIAVDSKGLVLEIHKYSKGLVSSAPINAIDLTGRTLQVKGTKTIYFVHNHPSGKLELSPEDVNITNFQKSLASIKDAEVSGLVIGGTSYLNMDTGEVHKIKPILRSMKLPVKERHLQKTAGFEKIEPVTNSREAMEYLDKVHNSGDGFLFLNAKLKPLGFLPMPLKGTTMKALTTEMLQTAENLNAAAYMFNSSQMIEGVTGRGDYLRELNEQLGNTLQLMEVIEMGISYADTGRLHQYKLKEKGLRPAMGTLGTETPVFSAKKAPVFFSQMQKTLEAKLQGKGTSEQYLNTVRKMAAKGTIKAEELEWSGLEDYIESQAPAKIKKADILSWLRANALEVEETHLWYDPARRRKADYLKWPRDPGNEYKTIWKNPVDNQEHTFQIEKLTYKDAAQEVEAESWYMSVDGEREGRSTTEAGAREKATDWADDLYENALTDASRLSWSKKEGAKVPTWIAHGKDLVTGESTTWEIEQQEDSERPGHYVFPIYEGGQIWPEDEIGSLIEARRFIEQEIEESIRDEINSAMGIDTDVEWPSDLPKYEDRGLTLPGGENYQELLLKLPIDIPTERAARDKRLKDLIKERDSKQKAGMSIDYVQAKIDSVMTESDTEGERTGYKSSHWDQLNVVAHTRVKDRTDAQGRKVLFLEEIQSDWHQIGREKGYGFKKFTEDDIEVRGNTIKLKGRGQEVYNSSDSQSVKIAKALKYFNENIKIQLTPDAPFKKSWPMLVIKRMVRWAALEGYDVLAWAPGDVHNLRYDLSQKVTIQYAKQIDGKYWIHARNIQGGRTVFEKTVNVEEIAGIAGKEIKDKIVAGKGKKYKHRDQTHENLVKRGPVVDIVKKEKGWYHVFANGDTMGVWDDKEGAQTDADRLEYTISQGPTMLLEGPDMKVGGEPMRIFYDRKLKNEVNRFFDKTAWGNAHVEVGHTRTDRQIGEEVTSELLNAAGDLAHKAQDPVAAKFLRDQAISIDQGKGHSFAVFNTNPWPGADKPPGHYFDQARKYEDKYQVMWSLPVTPQMREKALTEGMPLFSVKKAMRIPDSADLSTRDYRVKLSVKDDHPGHQVAKTFSESHGEHHIRFDGEWDRSEIDMDPMYQFTIHEGPATGLTFTAETLEPEEVESKFTKIITPFLENKAAMMAKNRIDPITQTYIDALKAAQPDAFITSPDLDQDPDEDLPKEIAETLEASKGLGRLSILDRFGDTLKEIWQSSTRHRPYLDPKEYADISNVLRIHQEVPSNSVRRAGQVLSAIMGGLKPRQYKVFARKLLMDDMMKDLESGLLEDPENLPFGFNEKEARKYLGKLNAIAEADPVIKDAIKRRNTFNNKLKRALVNADLLPESVMDDERYFHHQVLQYRAVKEIGADYFPGIGVSSKDVRLKKKGWQRGRIGSSKDYNSDYAESEFEVIAQAIAQLETKSTMFRLKELADIMPALKTEAKSQNLHTLYVKEAERLSAADPSGRTWKHWEVQEEADPLSPFKAEIAKGLNWIGNLAKKFKLENGSKDFTDVLEALEEWQRDVGDEKARAKDEGREARLPPFPFDELGSRAWAYFNHMMNENLEGAPAAGIIFKAIRQRNEFIKEYLGKDFLKPTDIMPDDHTVWKPAPGSSWYKAYSLSDRIVDAVQAGEMVIGQENAEKVKQILARGRDIEWIVPTDVAKTLDGYDIKYEDHMLSTASRKMMTGWKQWILINPYRVVKYNLNNMSGDMDISIAYDPKIVFKYLPAATKDMFKDWKQKKMSPELKAELDLAHSLGVVGSGWSVQEVADVSRELAYDQHMQALTGEKPTLIRRGWRGLQGFTNYRENILRLAAFRYFQTRLAAGEKNIYAASNKKEIDGIKNNTEKAAKLARELIGDYGNITHSGQWLRRHLIPFYAWMEVNAPRYVRLMRNLKHEGQGARKIGRALPLLGKNIAWKGSKLAMKATAIYVLVNLWNRAFFPDEDDELGEAQRRQLHIIIPPGRREDGTIITLRFQGALSDALAWFGGEDIHHDVKDLVQGKMPITEYIKETALAAPIKIIHGVRPDVKAGAELLSGMSYYPDPFNPRPIYDKLEHVTRLFSLNGAYGWLTGKPKRGDTTGERLLNDLMALGFYNSDPGESAYYDIRSKTFDYLDKIGMERPSRTATSKGTALHYYKQALKFGDLKAAEKYLDQYINKYKGTKTGITQSIKRVHPLGSLAKKDRRAFMATLNEGEKERYQLALRWYNETYLKRRREVKLPQREGTSVGIDQPGEGGKTLREMLKIKSE